VASSGGSSRRASGVPIAERGPGWSYRADTDPPSLFGRHQPGVDTPRLDHLRLAVFDLHAPARDVLQAWTRVAEGLLGHDLTVTLGIGPAALAAAQRPVRLRELPPFEGDALDPARCGGDLVAVVMADDAGRAAAATDALTAAAGDAVGARAPLTGWLDRGRGDAPAGTPRDPLGFRDGTNNLRRGRDIDRYVWIDGGDRTGMLGGTYLVVRQIAIDVAAFAARPLSEQERIVGRRRDSGAPPDGRREFDPAPLDAFPPGSHVRLASPRTNRVPPMLRRSYSFEEGLLFLAFMRDPARQFVPVQRRLALHDPLAGFARHVGSAVFAVPPGARPGGFVGEPLLSRSPGT
jgi:deferrochelatase/peroxidase EfeB